MKLWEKGLPLNPAVEAFTVGEDLLWDLQLLVYDLQASVAHAKALQRVGVLSETELTAMLAALEELRQDVEQGTFSLEGFEDGHTAIETALVSKLGELGQKIHTGRSRNDQVLVALRLLVRDRLADISQAIVRLEEALASFVERSGSVAFPGYTHTRPAMPTTLGTWAEGLHHALIDDHSLLLAVEEITDQNPLGTGAGFGVPLLFDREQTTRDLGFRRLQVNPIYTQHSRAKFDALVLHVLVQVLYDLNRFASDLIFFSLLGYVCLPDWLTTGSSIMPQKKNPDLLELVRASYHVVVSYQLQTLQLSANLISGYHRDLQLLKRPLLESFRITQESLQMMALVFTRLEVDPQTCATGITQEVRSTERVFELVSQGIPFREAYRQVADQLTQKPQKHTKKSAH
jgi:argininosuccinate lyase